MGRFDRVKHHIESEASRLCMSIQVPRVDERNEVKQTMKMEVRGSRAKGRQRMRWRDNIKPDINECGLGSAKPNTRQ